ncbi:MFS transporter [Streptomyces sp. GLT-R25]
MDTSKSGAENSAESETGAPGPAVPAEPAEPERSGGWRRWAMDTRPLRRPAYRRLWSSTIVTAVGSQLTAVAVPKQIYDITGSSAWVGYASFAGLLPLVVFALWGGAIADSVDRRKLLLVTNIGIAVTSLLFWIQAVTGLESVGVLMVLLAVQQAFFGLNSPARQASIARLVPKDELAAANALGSTVMQTGLVAGPLLAGALIPVVGLAELYLIDALALCATVWAVYRLPSHCRPWAPPRRQPAGQGCGGSRRASATSPSTRCSCCPSSPTSSPWSSACRAPCSRSWPPRRTPRTERGSRSGFSSRRSRSVRCSAG